MAPQGQMFTYSTVPGKMNCFTFPFLPVSLSLIIHSIPVYWMGIKWNKMTCEAFGMYCRKVVHSIIVAKQPVATHIKGIQFNPSKMHNTQARITTTSPHWPQRSAKQHSGRWTHFEKCLSVCQSQRLLICCGCQLSLLHQGRCASASETSMRKLHSRHLKSCSLQSIVCMPYFDQANLA